MWIGGCSGPYDCCGGNLLCIFSRQRIQFECFSSNASRPLNVGRSEGVLHLISYQECFVLFRCLIFKSLNEGFEKILVRIYYQHWTVWMKPLPNISKDLWLRMSVFPEDFSAESYKEQWMFLQTLTTVALISLVWHKVSCIYSVVVLSHFWWLYRCEFSHLLITFLEIFAREVLDGRLQKLKQRSGVFRLSVSLQSSVIVLKFIGNVESALELGWCGIRRDRSQWILQAWLQLHVTDARISVPRIRLESLLGVLQIAFVFQMVFRSSLLRQSMYVCDADEETYVVGDSDGGGALYVLIFLSQTMWQCSCSLCALLSI